MLSRNDSYCRLIIINLLVKPRYMTRLRLTYWNYNRSPPKKVDLCSGVGLLQIKKMKQYHERGGTAEDFMQSLHLPHLQQGEQEEKSGLREDSEPQ